MTDQVTPANATERLAREQRRIDLNCLLCEGCTCRIVEACEYQWGNPQGEDSSNRFDYTRLIQAIRAHIEYSGAKNTPCSIAIVCEMGACPCCCPPEHIEDLRPRSK